MIASMLVEIRSTEGLVSIVGIIAGASDPKIIWYKEVKDMNELKRFLVEEDAVSTVEVILIVVVLIALVVLFKSQITTVVNNILTKVTTQADAV